MEIMVQSVLKLTLMVKLLLRQAIQEHQTPLETPKSTFLITEALLQNLTAQQVLAKTMLPMLDNT